MTPPRLPDTKQRVSGRASRSRAYDDPIRREKIKAANLAAYHKNKLDPVWLDNHRRKIREAFARRRAADPVGTRRFDWDRRQVGWTPERYNEYLDAQEGCCAICGVEFSTLRRGPAADHDHATGEPRALLCWHCNSGLGMFADDRDRMVAAVAYLIEHNGNASRLIGAA